MRVFKINTKFTIFLALLLTVQALFPQSEREIGYRNKLVQEWGRSGIFPLSGTSSNGTQNLAVLAYGSYFPLSYTAKAGVASVLRIYTNKTYDCSRAFFIPELNIKKNLPSSGIVEIPIPAKKKGQTLFGTCSMGMYTFTIKFE